MSKTYEVIREPSPSLKAYRKAIGWIYAPWSAHSRDTRKKLLQAIDAELESKIELFEIDHDSLDISWYQKMCHVSFAPQGDGDVLWVYEGEVFDSDTNCCNRDIDYFRAKARSLMNR